MAQFDVHRNAGKKPGCDTVRRHVQSALFDSYKRRVVVPVVRESTLGKISSPRFNPAFKVATVAVVLHPLEIASVALEKLGEKVGSLAPEGDAILSALDEPLTRAWG